MPTVSEHIRLAEQWAIAAREFLLPVVEALVTYQNMPVPEIYENDIQRFPVIQIVEDDGSTENVFSAPYSRVANEFLAYYMAFREEYILTDIPESERGRLESLCRALSAHDPANRNFHIRWDDASKIPPKFSPRTEIFLLYQQESEEDKFWLLYKRLQLETIMPWESLGKVLEGVPAPPM